jgi:hypothetical protein
MYFLYGGLVSGPEFGSSEVLRWPVLCVRA